MKTYPGLYRGVVLSVNPTTLDVKCRVPSVTLHKIVTAVACLPPGWHDKNRDLLQDHPDHGDHVFTDPQGGSEDLVHNPNHGSAHPHRLTTVTPRPGIEGVWVMYEGGEPEHPVWIGTYRIGGN
jgi:hypothetical protein